MKRGYLQVVMCYSKNYETRPLEFENGLTLEYSFARNTETIGFKIFPQQNANKIDLCKSLYVWSYSCDVNTAQSKNKIK